MEVLGDGGKVRAMKFQRCRLGSPDEGGRCKAEPIPGDFFEIPCDNVIFAIGQAIVDDFIATDGGAQVDGVVIARNAIKTDPGTMVTGRPGVFAGGDAAPQGPLTAIQAIASVARRLPASTTTCAASRSSRWSGSRCQTPDPLRRTWPR